ncbi:hypothetical protein ACFXGT_08040 [Streptomyces sp. NPDC059352]|uniref:hypothetical protein n=1 Tax=Streptomyces sp. NPDC059352 TaxID=3346810 RepID=UPI00369C216B
MPHIRVLEAVAGADFSWAPGDVVEVSEEAAAVWADGHRAVFADDDGAAVPASSERRHLVPLIVGEDGQVLDVVDAGVLDVEPPEDAAGGNWVRWSVTVRVPCLPADGDGPGGAADPADVENQEPGQNDEGAALFDPDQHSNREVLAYLETADEEEALRVLDTEAAGQNRAGIAKMRDQVLEAARARGPVGLQAGAEKAADFSRGGGGEPVPETRSW